MMKALRFNAYGQPDVLRLEEIETPVPAAGEVLVKVVAAAINPSDVKNVAGLFSASLPRTPGRDFAGTVVSAGAWQGREVWGSGAGFGVVRDGAQREYLCLPEAWLSAKPANLTLAQAATVGVPFVTAWAALMRAGTLQPGETLLVTGSSGAVGRAAIQIAKWQGARVIGVGNPAQRSQADLLLDARSPDWLAAARAATEGRGADIVFDIVGGPLFETALQALRQGGRQIAIASAGSRRVEFDLLDFYHQQLQLIGVDTMKLTGPEIAAILDALRPGFEAGVLTPATHQGWSPERAAEAYGIVAAGHAAQKQVLVFG
jgi:NADPH2:quinone reductase